MRKPHTNEILNEQQRFLYSNDLTEMWEPGKAPSRFRWYRRRLAATLRAIKEIAPRGWVLDLGCAQANMAILLAEDGFEVVAADLKLEFLRYARLKVDQGDVRFVVANAAAPPFKPVFDVVLLGELLEHCAYPGEILKMAASLLKPEGKCALIVTTPHGGYFGNRLPTYRRIVDRGRLEEKQFKPDADGHLFLFTVSELRGLAEDVGLSVGGLCRYGTPLVTGHMKLKWLVNRIPPRFNNWVLWADGFLSRVPPISDLFTEGMLVVLRAEG